MFHTKNIFKHGKKVKIGIEIEKTAENVYKISDFRVSKNGKDWITYANNTLKNNDLIYKIAKNCTKEHKLLYHNKLVETCDIGTLTMYCVEENIVIPCSLIDEAVEMLSGKK